jgi:hypothetical protein
MVTVRLPHSRPSVNAQVIECRFSQHSGAFVFSRATNPAVTEYVQIDSTARLRELLYQASSDRIPGGARHDNREA